MLIPLIEERFPNFQAKLRDGTLSSREVMQFAETQAELPLALRTVLALVLCTFCMQGCALHQGQVNSNVESADDGLDAKITMEDFLAEVGDDYKEPEWTLDSLETLLKERPHFFRFAESVRELDLSIEEREKLFKAYESGDFSSLNKREYDLYLNRCWFAEFNLVKREIYKSTYEYPRERMEMHSEDAFLNGRGKIVTMKSTYGKEKQIEVRLLPLIKRQGDHRIPNYDPDHIVVTYGGYKYPTLLAAMEAARDDLLLEL
ncbi:hypothetical protein KJ742_02160 [Patescibacteria group bacterium]|nr:hypothetical protein [Patescibacteria group bacterium]